MNDPIKYDPSNVRLWSLLGPRGAFGAAMLSIAKRNENVVAITSDVANTAGLDRFRTAYPERLINTGIAEQNMLGIAAGFATEDLIPFAISFATFSVLRACESTRHFMGYMQRNVKLVGIGSGMSMGVFGNTHYGLEDIAVIRAIPGIVILSPSDSTSVVKATWAAARYNGPVYLRLTGIMNNPVVYREDHDFEIGKAITLKEGNDILVVATGSMVYNALQVAAILENKGISATVVDMHTIKPLDTSIFENKKNAPELIVSVEEHSKIGGLGGAIAEYLSSTACRPPLLRLGISDKFQKAGDYRYMLEQNELLPEQIAAAIEKKFISLMK